MATASISIPIGLMVPESASVPGATASGATFAHIQSSASAPSPAFVQAVFANVAIQQGNWQFRMPADYASGLVAKAQWKANATSGTPTMACRIAAVTPGDPETPNEKAYGSPNGFTGLSPDPTEARRLVESSCTVTNADSVAAGDWVEFFYRIDTSATLGSLAADLELVSLTLEYTTT